MAWMLMWTQARGSEWGPWRARPPCFYPTACFIRRYLWTASCSLHLHLQATIISCKYFQEPSRKKKKIPTPFCPLFQPYVHDPARVTSLTQKHKLDFAAPQLTLHQWLPRQSSEEAKAQRVSHSEDPGNPRATPGSRLRARRLSA